MATGATGISVEATVHVRTAKRATTTGTSMAVAMTAAAATAAVGMMPGATDKSVTAGRDPTCCQATPVVKPVIL